MICQADISFTGTQLSIIIERPEAPYVIEISVDGLIPYKTAYPPEPKSRWTSYGDLTTKSVLEGLPYAIHTARVRSSVRLLGYEVVTPVGVERFDYPQETFYKKMIRMPEPKVYIDDGTGYLPHELPDETDIHDPNFLKDLKKI